MGKHLRSASLGALAVLGLALGASIAGATTTVPVTGWKALLDGGADPIAFLGGSEATNSPSYSNAVSKVIAGNFTPATLANDGDFIRLTGSVSFSLGVPEDKAFRWGLFDGDDPVVAGDGTGYVGYMVEMPVQFAGNVRLRSGDGTGNIPFSSSAFVDDLGPASPENLPVGGSITGGTVLDFTLTIVKDGATADVSASVTDGADYLAKWSADGATPFPGSFTYDSISFLNSSGMPTGSQANYSNIEVTTGDIWDGDFDLNGVVDGKDFLLWQRGGSPDPLSATDLAVWEVAYGSTLISPVVTAVPEPASWMLFSVLALATFRIRVPWQACRAFCVL